MNQLWVIYPAGRGARRKGSPEFTHYGFAEIVGIEAGRFVCAGSYRSEFGRRVEFVPIVADAEWDQVLSFAESRDEARAVAAYRAAESESEAKRAVTRERNQRAKARREVAA